MTEYVVLLPGDEADWEAAPEERRRDLPARGVRQAARGAGPQGHRRCRAHPLPRRQGAAAPTPTGAEVTDGPYAETVEQLTGFYVIDTDDLDDLLEVCKILGEGEGVIEVRACTGGGTSS